MNTRTNIRLKYLFSKRIGGAWGNEPDADNSIVCIRAADFDTDVMTHSKTDLTRRSFEPDEIEKKQLFEGDLIIEKSGGGDNQPVGRVVRFDLNETALCSNFLELLRPNQDIVQRSYLSYLLYSLWNRRIVTASIKQTTGLQNLDVSDYFDNKVQLPQLLEQCKIVEYLDTEISFIDHLIKQKQNQLEFLSEKRQALITQAVTKGINPKIELRDSGIAWLGEVPEHWTTIRLKYLGNIFYGLSQPPKYIPEGTPLIRATNVFRGSIKHDGLVFIDESELETEKKIKLKVGDIIVVRSGAYTGDSAIVTEEWKDAIAGFDMIIRPNNNVNSKFLAIILLSSYVLDNQLLPLRIRAAQPHLNSEELGSVTVFLPSLDEQQEILDFLNIETDKIDTLADATKTSIELLKERRSTVITAAVTGQLQIPS